MGGSPRSAGGSDAGSFQTAASALGPRACEILCEPFESGVSVSHSHLALQKVSALAFKAKHPEDLSSWHRTPGLESLTWGSDPSLLGRTSEIAIIFLFISHLPKDEDLDYIMSQLLLLSHCSSFLISLVVENIFCFSAVHSY